MSRRKQKFNRRIVRERVLQVLFAYEMNRDSLQFLMDNILVDIKGEQDKEFAEQLIHKVLAHVDEFDKMIQARVANWEMNRIALIDKLLLRMGICELFYFPDIPPKVSINESIEIAKIYSTGGSSKFINGILDAILTEAKQKGTLNKTGRGLLEETIAKQPD